MAGAERLFLQVGADVSDLTSGMDKANKSIDKFEKNTRGAEKSGVNLSAGLLGVAGSAVALGAGLADVIGTAATFEKKMSAVKSTSGATDRELKDLEKTALALGMANDVGSVSASDAADAIFELGKAGVSIEKINNGAAKATLQLAAAAGPEFGVANAAALAADAMNSFSKSGLTAERTANVLVGAANASSIGLDELKYSMSAVGAVANTVGLSFEDTSAAIALFGNAGIKGSDAGTSLKTMLLGLQPTSSKQIGLFQELGLVTADGANQFFDATGKVKSMADIAGTLQAALSGMTEQQKLATLETMFGTDAIRVAAVLAEKGALGITDMAAAITKQGDAAKTAGEMNNNLAGKWEALMGTIDTLKIQLGTALLPVLTTVVEKLGGFFSAIASGDANQVKAFFDDIGGPVGLLGSGLTIAAVAATDLIKALTGDTDKATERVKVHSEAWNDLYAANGIAQKVQASAWDSFWTNTGKGLELFKQGWNETAAERETQLANFKTGWDGFWNNLTTGLELFKQGWNETSAEREKQLSDFKTGWDGFWNNLTTGLGLFKQGWNETASERERQLTAFGAGWTSFWTNVGIGIENFKIGWNSGWSALGGGLQAFSNAWNILWAAIGTGLSGVKQKFDGFVLDIGNALKGVVTGAAAIGTGIINGIKSGLSGGWPALVTYVKGLATGLFEAAKATLGIKSPSRVFADGVGAPIVQGIITGMNMKMPEADQAIFEMGKTLLAAWGRSMPPKSVADLVTNATKPAMEELFNFAREYFGATHMSLQTIIGMMVANAKAGVAEILAEFARLNGTTSNGVPVGSDGIPDYQQSPGGTGDPGGGGGGAPPVIPLAKGFDGWVKKPTYFLVGEAGPEYMNVTPRSGLPGLMEALGGAVQIPEQGTNYGSGFSSRGMASVPSNTVTSGRGNRTIVLEINGRTFAEAVVPDMSHALRTRAALRGAI